MRVTVSFLMALAAAAPLSARLTTTQPDGLRDLTALSGDRISALQASWHSSPERLQPRAKSSQSSEDGREEPTTSPSSDKGDGGAAPTAHSSDAGAPPEPSSDAARESSSSRTSEPSPTSAPSPDPQRPSEDFQPSAPSPPPDTPVTVVVTVEATTPSPSPTDSPAPTTEGVAIGPGGEPVNAATTARHPDSSSEVPAATTSILYVNGQGSVHVSFPSAQNYWVRNSLCIAQWSGAMGMEIDIILSNPDKDFLSSPMYLAQNVPQTFVQIALSVSSPAKAGDGYVLSLVDSSNKTNLLAVSDSFELKQDGMSPTLPAGYSSPAATGGQYAQALSDSSPAVLGPRWWWIFGPGLFVGLLAV